MLGPTVVPVRHDGCSPHGSTVEPATVSPVDVCPTFRPSPVCGLTGTSYRLAAVDTLDEHGFPRASAPRIPRTRDELRALVAERQHERDTLALMMMSPGLVS